MMWLFGLIVISAIIDRHGSDCWLSAKISRSLETNECPSSCSCKWELQRTIFDCSIECCSERDWNSNIQEIFDPFIENITHFRISHGPKMNTIPEIICTMRHLEELDLSQNAITKLPIGCFTRLDRVRVLDFAHNRISEIRKGTFDWVFSNCSH